MNILLATKGSEQSNIGRIFVMIEGIAEKNIIVSPCIDSCTNLTQDIQIDILIVGLDLI